jgi:hypothetical protein
MNFELIFGIIIFCVIIFCLMCSNNINKKEHLNEGTFYETNPIAQNNLDAGLYPMCTKDIRNDATNNRYCNDLPSFKKKTERLYGSPFWIQTKIPSYFWTPFSTKMEPNVMYAPDWLHRYE